MRAEGNRNIKKGQEMAGCEEYIGNRYKGVKDAMDTFGK